MRRFAWLLFVLWACSDEVTYEAGTQITVRVQGSLAVQGADSLTIQVAPFVGGAFVAREPVDVSLSGLDWPVDLPVVPGEGQSKDTRFEVVVRAVVAADAIAEARAITSFVRGEQRVLTLNLIGCGQPPICEGNASCHGTECLTCVAGSCEATKETAGSTLPPFDPDRIPANNPVEAAEDGSDAGPVDGDADTPACVDDEITCQGDDAFVCRQGAFVLAEECDYGCAAGACTPQCTVDERTCDALQPRVCDAEGSWQNDGDPCPFMCAAGECVGECAPRDVRCADNARWICSESGTWTEDRICADMCVEGACRTLTSCQDEMECGQGSSCCESHVVDGGTFLRSYDRVENPDDDFPATVATFRLDRYEVTLGRFRRFVDVFVTMGRPPVGAGKNPNDPNDPGWLAAFNEQLPTDLAALREGVSSCPDAVWTSAMVHEDMPMNCVTWYEAAAFCIWDGGRLPTEAEWNYAAAGGAQQRVYPWSDPPMSADVDDSRAVYSPAPLAPVGSKSAGDGRYGQSDLAGNLQEWVRDWFNDPYSSENCVNCADLASGDGKAIRGGAYAYLPEGMTASYRSGYPETMRSGRIGFRCAR